MSSKTIEDNLRSTLSDMSNALLTLQEDAQLFLDLDFDDNMLVDAVVVLGTIAKNIGYRRDIVNDENLSEKFNNLLRVVEDLTGKEFLKY